MEDEGFCPSLKIVTDKILEEVLKYFVTFLLGGIVFGLGKVFNYWSDSKIREAELKRDLTQIKFNQHTQSQLLSQIDTKLDAQDDRADVFDKRLAILEVYMKHSSSGFQRITPGES